MEVFNPEVGVPLMTGAVILLGDGVMGIAVVVGDGDLTCPNNPARERREFGVLAVIVLLLDSGRSLGVLRTLPACERDCFLIWLGGLMESRLLGVGVAFSDMAALTLLFPGVAIDPFCARLPKRCGVVGLACGVPSLVVGRALFPSDDAGRSGGGIAL